MRRHYFFSKSQPVAQKYAQNECRPAGGHVHDGATGEVDRGDFRGRIPDAIHPAIDSPHHVRDREIDHEHPGSDESEHGGEFHSLSDRSNDQCGRDDREHKLIHGEDILRHPVGVIAVRVRIDTVEKSKFQSAEKR